MQSRRCVAKKSLLNCAKDWTTPPIAGDDTRCGEKNSSGGCADALAGLSSTVRSGGRRVDQFEFGVRFNAAKSPNPAGIADSFGAVMQSKVIASCNSCVHQPIHLPQHFCLTRCASMHRSAKPTAVSGCCHARMLFLLNTGFVALTVGGFWIAQPAPAHAASFR